MAVPAGFFSAMLRYREWIAAAAGAATTFAFAPQGFYLLAVLALARMQEFNEFFGTRFSDEEYDTIGGLVLHQFGRLPRRGEAVTMDGLEFKVLRADRRRIDQLRVTTPEPVPARPGEPRGA